MKFVSSLVTLLVGLMAVSGVQAANVRDDLALIAGGVLVCPAAPSGLQAIRNINADREIFFKRIVAYDADGSSVYDSAVSGFPVGFKVNLLPKQGTKLDNSGWSGFGQVWFTFQVRRPGGAKKVTGLPPMMVSIFPSVDPATGEPLARHRANCRYQKIVL